MSRWLNEKYKKPRISPEWLQACYEWVITEKALNPAMPGHKTRIQNEVEAQLLQSDLADSTISNTGLPANLCQQQGVVTLRGPPILVEIVALTDIGHSAFSLQNARQARIDKADLTGLAADEAEEDNSVHKYPRGTLRFELSDGTTTLQAFEHKPLPQLVLGETPLGYKLQLKDVRVRRGIAFLEPRCVELKGFETADREARQDSDFQRGLQLRLGRVVPLDDGGVVVDAPTEPAQPANPRARPAQPPNHPSEAGPSNPTRRVKKELAPTRPPNSSLVKSHFFSGSPMPNPSAAIAKERVLSPRTKPTNVYSGDEEHKPNPKPESKANKDDSQKAKQKAPPAPDSDFGDDSMFLDDEFLDELNEIEANALGRSDGKKASQSTTLTSGGSNPKTESKANRSAISIEDSFEFDEDGWDIGMEDFYVPVKNSPPPGSQQKTKATAMKQEQAPDNDDVIEISD